MEENECGMCHGNRTIEIEGRDFDCLACNKTGLKPPHAKLFMVGSGVKVDDDEIDCALVLQFDSVDDVKRALAMGKATFEWPTGGEGDASMS